jgi:hypothetical protein
VLDKAQEQALTTRAIILENEITSPTLREIEACVNEIHGEVVPTDSLARTGLTASLNAPSLTTISFLSRRQWKDKTWYVRIGVNT